MSKLTVYRAGEAADIARVDRVKISAACVSGALPAADATPQSSKRSWRILAEDLRDWIRAGMPSTPN